MAVTYVGQVTVFGNKRISIGTATLTGVTSGTFATGLDYIDGGSITPLSASTSLRAIHYFNTGSAATSIPGNIDITTGTAGDDYAIVAIGR